MPDATSPIIKVDLSNTELVARLRAKLDQYNERLAKDPYKAPEMQIPTIYRQRLVEALLERGELATWDFWREISDQVPHDTDDWNESCAIVDDYVTTGGMNVLGGGGFAAVRS